MYEPWSKSADFMHVLVAKLVGFYCIARDCYMYSNVAMASSLTLKQQCGFYFLMYNKNEFKVKKNVCEMWLPSMLLSPILFKELRT